MPLETLGKDEKLNIKKVEMPDLKPAENFDPQKYMTDEDWREIKEILANSVMGPGWDSEGWMQYVRASALLAELFPEQKEKFALNQGGFPGSLSEGSSIKALNSKIDSYYAFKVLFPDKAKEWLESQAGAEAYQKLLESQRKSFNDELKMNTFGRHAFLSLESLLKMNPDPAIERRQEIYSSFAGNLGKFPARINTIRGAAILKLAFPEQFQLEHLKDLEILKDLRGLLDEHRQEDGVNTVLEILLSLKILKAKNVAMTENGIVFGDEEQVSEFNKPISPLPETKKS